MSKIRFKRVWAKNFRSVDNAGMQLDFSEGTTLVGSLDNGAGKSTMTIHAIYYALYDKPYAKGTSKSQLINSRSNKDCVVEVEFEANGSTWIVRRGQKPTLFEIIKDGQPINDEAALKDYQVNLDKVIGMDEKAFCNTIALGKDKFVPFVSMSAPDRRNYGEQMLDLVVISRMNEHNKADIKLVQSEILQAQTKANNIEYEIRNVTNIIDLKKKHAEEAVAGVEEELAQERQKAAEATSEKASLDNELANICAIVSDLDVKFQERTRIANLVADAKQQLSDLEALALKKAAEGDICGHCGQPMPEKDRLEHAAVLEEKINKLKAGIPGAESKLNATDPDVGTKLEAAKRQKSDVEMKISGVRAKATMILERIKTLNAKKEAAQANNDWKEEQDKLDGFNVQLQSISEALANLTKKMKSHEIMASALKDDGVKAQMVEQYLPFINDRINDYLNRMNLFVNVNLNNEFEIELQAPDRRGQGIQSLSTGQQCRVDLAVLLAWRDVAKAAASCDSNILVLDEILENLSEQGVSDFLEMWKQVDGGQTGLYVISQRRSEFGPMFDRTITYRLIDDHTTIYDGE